MAFDCPIYMLAGNSFPSQPFSSIMTHTLMNHQFSSPIDIITSCPYENNVEKFPSIKQETDKTCLEVVSSHMPNIKKLKRTTQQRGHRGEKSENRAQKAKISQIESRSTLQGLCCNFPASSKILKSFYSSQ